jgi:alkaline phosphatase D
MKNSQPIVLHTRCVVFFFATLVPLCAASDGAPNALPSRIAFGSCAQPKIPQPVWATLLSMPTDLFIFCGDNIYASGNDAAEFEEQYALLANNSAFPEFRSKVPILATWDDHDFGKNDAGVENPWKTQAKHAFLKFFKVPDDSPRRTREGIYDSVMFESGGRRLQVILLDTRWFRSPLRVMPKEERFDKGKYGPHTETTTTILGEAQWQWLEEQLQLPADLRILTSSIQIVPEEHGFEKWANFPHERARLFALLRKTNAAPLIVISGDRHFSEISMLKPDAATLPFPLYEVTASALNQSGSLYKEPNRHRVGSEGYGLPNFGLLEIDWQQTDPDITLAICDAASGDKVLISAFPLSHISNNR